MSTAVGGSGKARDAGVVVSLASGAAHVKLQPALARAACRAFYLLERYCRGKQCRSKYCCLL